MSDSDSTTADMNSSVFVDSLDHVMAPRVSAESFAAGGSTGGSNSTTNSAGSTSTASTTEAAATTTASAATAASTTTTTTTTTTTNRFSLHERPAEELDTDNSNGLNGGDEWQFPTSTPSSLPSLLPSLRPSAFPSSRPSALPSSSPSQPPSLAPSVAPTASPSSTPSTPPPTEYPTYSPTLRGDPFVLRGQMWYDRNANGVRDANVRVDGMGSNVEFTHGLGGVTVRLVECFPGDPGYYGDEDGKTNPQQKQEKEQNAADAFAAGGNGEEEEEEEEEISLESYAGTVTLGYDVKMHSGLAGENEQGGKYNLINIKINRSYYIYATSTEGYLFTTGICNDDYPGWECKAIEAGKDKNEEEENEKQEIDSNSDSAAAPSKRRLVNPIDNYNSAHGHSFFGRFLGRMLNQSSDDSDKSSASNQANESLLQYQTMGIPEGRSDRCVNIDRRGLPDFALNMGVMHIGDPHTQKKTEVKLSMDIETVEAINNRRLVELIKEMKERKEKQVQRKRALRGADDNTEEDDDENYLLLEDKDMDAIGSVTAEVIATTLQPKLKSYGIELDGVLHKNVAMNLDVVKEDSEEGEGEQENSSLEEKQDDSQPQTQPEENPDNRSQQPQIATSNNNNTPNSKRSVDQLVVDLEVRGHYQPPPHLDFDYIVEQSINTEQLNIRRELIHYNQNCEDQRNTISTLKLSPYDFKEINSWRGTRPNRAKGDDGTLNIDTSTFRMACAQGIDIPEYLDPTTADISLNVDAVVEEVEKVTEVPAPVVEQQPFPWIMVTAIPVAGVLLLVLLFLVYKRGGILRKKNNKSASHEEDGNIAVVSPDDCDIFPESYADNWDEGKRTGDAKVEGKMAQEDAVANMTIQDKDIIGAVPSNSVDGRPANKKSAGLFSALSNTIRRELSNIQAALRSEQGPRNHNVVQDQTHSITATSALDDTFTNGTEKTISTIHNINGNNNNNNQGNDALPLDPALDKVLEEGSTLSRFSKQTSLESTRGEGNRVENNTATQSCIHEGYERKRSQGSASSKKKSRRKSQESERSSTNSDPSAGGHDDGAEEALAAVATRKKKSKRRSQDLDRSERSDISANDKKSANNRRRRRSSQEQLDQSDRSAFSGSLDESNTSRLSSSDAKKKSSRRISDDLGKSEPSSCCVLEDLASSSEKSFRRRKSDLDKSEPSSAAADEFSSRNYSKDVAKVERPKRRSRQLDRLEEPVIDDSSDGQDDVKSADSRSGNNKSYRKLNVEMKRRSTANESVSS